MGTFQSFILLGLLIVSANTVFALSPVNKTLLGGLAIKGYDPVSYFTESKPTKGNKKVELEHSGATWRFNSQQNLYLFKGDPKSYAPQFGGYCAWAVSQGSTAGIDPQAWKIVNEKLYLNYNKSIQKKWEKDRDSLIIKGNKNWSKLLKE